VPELGERLRGQREKKGITLEQAAADTRIREKFLAALESGDYKSLPGAVYTKGFLRNYAEYLDLDTEELLPLFQRERGQPEPQQTKTFKPYRPVVHNSLIFRPVIFVPVILIALVGLFAGYIYYQFSTFAVKPRLEIMEPATDLIATSGDLIVRGVTVADGRLRINAFPGPTIFDLKPDPDGQFAVTIALKPGANHIEAEVLDATGKTNRVSRAVQYQVTATGVSAPPVLSVEQPASGAAFTNTFVQVSGRVDRTVTSLQVNNAAVSVNGDGTFQTRFYLTAGPQSFRVVARNSAGGTVEETRNVTVAYTAAVVNVFVRGGDTWLLATVDGTDVAGSGRVYKDGETAVFTGKQVRIRAGNAAAAQVIYNGQPVASLGRQGEVVDRVFAAQ
jgi:cytoskeletal protein RodZ